MALLDIFKKSKQAEKKAAKSASKVGSVKVAQKKELTSVVVSPKIPLAGKIHPVKSAEGGVSPAAKQFNRVKKAGIAGIASHILKSAQITEKAAVLKDSNQYVFKVFESANKTEVKKSVEEVYKVEVLRVRIINVPRKKRRLGRTLGWRKSYKKAIVTLKKGQEIELIPR